jgi:hypothetical protein
VLSVNCVHILAWGEINDLPIGWKSYYI